MTRLLFYLFFVSLLFGCQDGSQTWMSYCDIDGHWEKKFNDGKKCSDAASKHLDRYNHSAGCKRVDGILKYLH